MKINVSILVVCVCIAQGNNYIIMRGIKNQ